MTSRRLRKEGTHHRQTSDGTDNVHSNPPSTRHLLADSHASQPLQIPFPRSRTDTSTSPRPEIRTTPFSPAQSVISLTPTYKDLSLSVNYLPSKFTRPHSIHRRRKRERDRSRFNDADRDKSKPKFKVEGLDLDLVPRGGGREAFRKNESRMPDVGDQDYDGLAGNESRATKGRLRWNRFKWILVLSNTLFTTYSLASLIFCLLTLFNVWTKADAVRVANSTELTLSLLASSSAVFTSLIGWAGILLNNRPFLSIYTLFLWITFIFLLAPGYMSYKTRSLNLEAKLSAAWSRSYGPVGRLRIQNQLGCCGYFSPFIEATVSQSCYARSLLPGCKGPFWRFEKMVLKRWYTIAFALVPVHLGCFIAAVLCSNHVTYRFGKGLMPRAYRLSVGSMAIIMENYANQLAGEYGTDFASEVLHRSRSHPNLRSDTEPPPVPPVPPMPYVPERQQNSAAIGPASGAVRNVHRDKGGKQHPKRH